MSRRTPGPSRDGTDHRRAATAAPTTHGGRQWAPPTIVLLAAAVHVARRNVVDIVVFLGVAGLMTALRTRDLPSRPLPQWMSAPVVPVAAAAVLGTAVLTESRTAPLVRGLLAVVGVVALVVVLRAGRGAAGDVRGPGRVGPAWPWAAVVLTGCLVELGNFLSQPDPDTANPGHPTLSTVVDPLLAAPPARAVFVVVWVVLGWLLVRTIADRSGRPR